MAYEAGLWDEVSIHAPVWGATQLLLTERQALDVSIHAPVWGATGSGEQPSPEGLN